MTGLHFNATGVGDLHLPNRRYGEPRPDCSPHRAPLSCASCKLCAGASSCTPPDFDTVEAHAFYTEQFDHRFQIFVVEHDWAAAFERAIEAGALPDGGDDYRLPYPACCFEFVINEKRVCVGVRQSADPGYQHVVTAVLETSQGWMYLPLADPLYESTRVFLAAQVRAVCIAIGAVIAEAQLVTIPERLKRARERRGRRPLSDYHVVKLARRRRIASLNKSEQSDRRRVRLHLRRGHWRRQGDSVWIGWMLVGDPELGFIEKHYRL